MSGVIPDSVAAAVVLAYRAASDRSNSIVRAVRDDFSNGGTPEEIFYAMSTTLSVRMDDVTPSRTVLPPDVIHLFREVAETLAVSHVRLATLPEERAAVKPSRVILEPGQEHRVAIMLPTGRIVDVVMTCETRGDRPQLVATIGARDVGHVAIRTPETAKWGRL